MNALSTRHPLLLSTCLWFAAMIHLLPLPGLLGTTQLQQLYGLGDLDPASELLLRHRAWMFALFAALLISATRVCPLRPAAIALTLLSDLGILLLALGGPLPPSLERVLLFDLLSLAVLLIAAWRSGLQRVGAC